MSEVTAFIFWLSLAWGIFWCAIAVAAKLSNAAESEMGFVFGLGFGIVGLILAALIFVGERLL